MDKKTVFCITDHPDDEAFGPSGTLALLARTHDVHIICVTNGAADPRFHAIGGKELSLLRIEELKASARVLGIQHVHFLPFQDGTLSNNLYHEVAEKITTLVKQYKPSLFITYEFRGISGHLDHVAVSMIASFVYRQNRSIDAIWYSCGDRNTSKLMQKYFVFFPPGFERNDVDLVVNIKSVLKQKIAAAKCHKTQYKDGLRIIAKWLVTPKEEWFVVNTRKAMFTEAFKAQWTV
jgi:LmbE family N-acetylglucosaminyl deacetylase